ncbi:MAG: outer membrane protein assembly factor BamD [Thiotrichales bacterium]|nr:MAG: outer membrane protein assembly factor BamD [Thiotrichales bacterium]
MQSKVVNRLLCVMFIAISLLLVSCGGKGISIAAYKGKSAQKVYKLGKHFLKKQGYKDAIAAFESLNAQYPFSKYSESGNLNLMYAYYEYGEPELALVIINRFLQLYPHSEHADYAYYVKGVIEFENHRNILQKYLPYKMSEHDDEHHILAFNTFKQLVKEYPKSKYAKDAIKRMLFIRDSVASHVVSIAKFYFDRKAYIAAIARAKEVIQHYEHTPAVKDALRIMLKSYRKLGLTKLADTTEKVWKVNFTKPAYKQHHVSTSSIKQQDLPKPAMISSKVK